MQPQVPNYHPPLEQPAFPNPSIIPPFPKHISAPIPPSANQIPTGTGPNFQPQTSSDFSFKAERAQRPFDKTSTTLLIASIPKVSTTPSSLSFLFLIVIHLQELNTIAKLNEHFSTFGTVVNIQVASW